MSSTHRAMAISILIAVSGISAFLGAQNTEVRETHHSDSI